MHMHDQHVSKHNVALHCAELYLLAHGLRVGNGGTEEAVPLQPAVQPGPVIMTITRVRQTPRDQCVELPVSRVTWFTL